MLAYNPATGKAEPELVQHVWINHDSDLVDVGLQRSASSGPTAAQTSASSASSRGKHLVAASLALAAALAISGQVGAPAAQAAHAAASPTTTTSETIHTTANHPWLTADRGWVAAGELRVGEPVVTLSGGNETSTVAWVHVVPGQADYYNLTVAKDHTYAVGDGRAVVHNVDPLCGGADGSKVPPGGDPVSSTSAIANIRASIAAGEKQTNITVLTRYDAQEVFFKYFWDPTFDLRSTTGIGGGRSGGEALFPKGFYHWDDTWEGDTGRLMWHQPDDADAYWPHLQVHLPPLSQGGKFRVIRVFWMYGK